MTKPKTLPIGKTGKGQLLILTIGLAVLAIANILWGSLDIPVREVWHIVCGGEVEGHPAWSIIVRQGRLPQMLTALLTGAALGTCGLLLQTAFRNPLAGPSILGIDAGANLGVAIVLLLLSGTATIGSLTIGGHLLVVVAAMCGALAIMSLLMILSKILRSQVMLLITGVIISYVTSSIIQLLNYSATEQGVHSFVIWGMGNFASVGIERLPSSVHFLVSDYCWRSCLSNPSMLFCLETVMPRIWALESDGCDNCSYSSQGCSQPPRQPSAVPSRSSAWQSRIWLVSHSAQPGTALFCLPQCLSEPIWHWYVTC